MSEQIELFMNLDKHGFLHSYDVKQKTDHYIRYLDGKPIDGVIPEALDRIYDYSLHKWYSIPGKPVCVYFNVELPYCEDFIDKASTPNKCG